VGGLNEADRCHGDHALDGRSIERRSGLRQPSGQFADYYPLIVEAVSRLESSTAETRSHIYDRARTVNGRAAAQHDTPFGGSEISREQLALEAKRPGRPLRSALPAPHPDAKSPSTRWSAPLDMGLSSRQRRSTRRSSRKTRKLG
jgi:hypothetical protein